MSWLLFCVNASGSLVEEGLSVFKTGLPVVADAIEADTNVDCAVVDGIVEFVPVSVTVAFVAEVRLEFEVEGGTVVRLVVEAACTVTTRILR